MTGDHFERINAYVDGRWPARLSPIQQAVWITYHRHADSNGESFPSPKTQAEVAGVRSLGHVRAARKRLVEMGMLEVVQQGDSRHSARYRVLIPPSPQETSPPAGLVPERDYNQSPSGTTSSPPAGLALVPQRDTQGNIEVHIEQPIQEHTRATVSRKRPRASEPPIPDRLNTPAFLEAWAEWKQHRREIRKPFTPTAIKRALNELEPIGPDKAVKAIHRALAKGWTGIYPPDDRSKNGSKSEGLGFDESTGFVRAPVTRELLGHALGLDPSDPRCDPDGITAPTTDDLADYRSKQPGDHFPGSANDPSDPDRELTADDRAAIDAG